MHGSLLQREVSHHGELAPQRFVLLAGNSFKREVSSGHIGQISRTFEPAY